MQNTKKFFLLLLFSTLQVVLTAQACLPNGITFTTQEQIDNFSTNYPECTEISGDLLIGISSSNTSITNLDGLNAITTIGGDLIISNNDALTHLTSLVSCQFTIDFEANSLTFMDIEKGSLLPMSANNFGLKHLEAGSITFSWNGEKR